MAENIVMQITEECNPNEARFRAGDFLIGTENTLTVLTHQCKIFMDNKYVIKDSTIEKLKQSNNVKYHYVYRKDTFLDFIDNFAFKLINKNEAFKYLLNKKQIAITQDDNRILKNIINDNEKIYFLNKLAEYESEHVLNEEWLIASANDYCKSSQIEYYKNLKTDSERKIYADAIGQQYALDILLSPIKEILFAYDLEILNTFFENIEFYYNDNINNDNSKYLTSLNVKELWLPAAHFSLDDNTETKTVNGIEFIQIDDAIEQYSFTSNRVRYDSYWYSDFLIKL